MTSGENNKIYKTPYVNLPALHSQSPNPGDKPTVPFKGWVAKQTVYQYNGILFSYTNELTANIGSHIYKSQMYFAKWKWKLKRLHSA